jgi:hypothetical protein
MILSGEERQRLWPVSSPLLITSKLRFNTKNASVILTALMINFDLQTISDRTVTYEHDMAVSRARVN